MKIKYGQFTFIIHRIQNKLIISSTNSHFLSWFIPRLEQNISNIIIIFFVIHYLMIFITILIENEQTDRSANPTHPLFLRVLIRKNMRKMSHIYRSPSSTCLINRLYILSGFHVHPSARCT